MTEQEKIEHIKSGSKTEKYREWATYGSDAVREELVEQGHCLDILIHDRKHTIRQAVMIKDPSYIKQRINYLDDQYMINNALDNLVTVDLGVLTSQIAYYENEYGNNPYLKIKYQALSREPTLLETTMDRVSLYRIGNPMWARDLPFLRVWTICDMLEDNQTLEQITKIFNKLTIEELTTNQIVGPIP